MPRARRWPAWSEGQLVCQSIRREDMSKLKNLLTEFVGVEGVKAAVVISSDGFVIEGETNGTGMDNDAVGAVVSVGIGSSAVMANELQVGDIAQTTFECAKG